MPNNKQPGQAQGKYNLLAWAIVSVVGGFFAILGITGLFFPFTLWLISLLPAGNWGISEEVFVVLCRGGLWAVALGVPAAWLLLRRSPTSRAQRQHKQARMDAFMDRNSEK